MKLFESLGGAGLSMSQCGSVQGMVLVRSAMGEAPW